MTYSIEKEFIRECFMNGSLDPSRDFETMKRFVQVMKGEMEALIAIQQNQGWLSKEETIELFESAELSKEMVAQVHRWEQMALTGKRTS